MPPFSILLVTSITLTIIIGVRSDAIVWVRRGLGQLLKWFAHATLSKENSYVLISWYEQEIADIQAERGSGVGVTLLFLCYTGPKFIYKTRRDAKTRR